MCGGGTSFQQEVISGSIRKGIPSAFTGWCEEGQERNTQNWNICYSKDREKNSDSINDKEGRVKKGFSLLSL